MQQRTWLYYILDAIGRSYYKKNGILTLSTTPKPLRYTPSAWQDVSLGWERSLENWGVVRTFSIPLEFVLDGQEIISEIFNTKTFEEVLYLLIQKQELIIDPVEYYFFHRFFYKGEIDLTTYAGIEDKATVNIMEGGVSKDLKANENTVYETQPRDVWVKMDGVNLVLHAQFLIYNGGDDTADIDFDLRNHFVALREIFLEKSAMISAQPVPRRKFLGTNIDLNGTPFWFFYATVACTVTVTYNFKIGATIVPGGVLDPSGRTTIAIQLVRGNLTDTYQIFHGLLPGSGQTFNGTKVIQVLPGDFLVFRTFFTVIGASGDAVIRYTYFPIANSFLTVDALVRYPHTYVQCNHAETVFKDLTEKITGSAANAESTLLSQKKNLVLISGDGLRGLDGAVIKRSMKEFSNDFHVVEAGTTGIIANKLRFEKKSFFLNEADPIPLGPATNCKHELFKELIYNTIRIGYTPKEIQDLNGKYAFNNTSLYSSPVKKIPKELTLVTTLIADPFVTELYRINLDGKTTTDNEKDTSLFILNIDYANPKTNAADDRNLPAGTTYYELKRVAYDSVEGVPSPTDSLFNVEDLTPARLMEKHASFYNSVFDRFEGKQLIYQTQDKNRELKTVKGTIVYDEDANITIKASPKLFKPHAFEFEPKTLENLGSLLLDNPNKAFSYVHTNGNTYTGFIFKIGMAAETLEKQVFRLLACPSQDLTTLKDK